jgi:probable rRNA maturation factor
VTLAVEVLYATRRPAVPPRVRLVEWARAAAGRHAAGAELAIRIVTPAESRRLNREYRGTDRPTNVLSFAGAWPRAAGLARAARGSAPCGRALGDLAICASVVAREARAQRKAARAHWAHMVVHGTLHLLGYDHARARDAARMERRERTILARLGFADPYAAGPGRGP